MLEESCEIRLICILNLMTIYIAAHTKHDLPEATHGIYILEVEVVITLDVSFRLNPVPITSHFGIDSRLLRPLGLRCLTMPGWTSFGMDVKQVSLFLSPQPFLSF